MQQVQSFKSDGCKHFGPAPADLFFDRGKKCWIMK